MHTNGSDGAVPIRRARPSDREAVVGFTADTWPDRDAGDYVPRVFDEWVRTDGDDQRTFVADADGRAVGIAQHLLLSDDEAWGQGLRVDPEFRGLDVGSALSRAAFAWARERGATVARGMVFSWNVAGLGHARANGFEPATEFRWARPEPDADADLELGVHDDPAAAWRYWTGSDARGHLRGLALAPEETWALRELTRETLRESADDDGLFVVRAGGTRGMAFRVREYAPGGDGETLAEYGVAAWDDAAACRALMRAVARDAGERGADAARVLVPETVRHVSDVALARVALSDEPDFVMEADLTDESLLS